MFWVNIPIWFFLSFWYCPVCFINPFVENCLITEPFPFNSEKLFGPLTVKNSSFELNFSGAMPLVARRR